MGMFDRVMDERGAEWQTKAFDRALHAWVVGAHHPVAFDCQFEVIGWSTTRDGADWAFATVRSGVLTEVTRERDESLPLIPYGGLTARHSTRP